MLGWVIEINMITIDIETRSDKDISKCGVYAYTDTPYFDILLFAYSIDEQPVQVVDMANGEEIPESILAALADENVVKRAFNVNFERVCLSKYLRKNYPQYFQSYSIDEDTVGDFLNPESWHCSMIHARTLGLPSSLAEVGKVLGIEQQKMTVFRSFIIRKIIPINGKFLKHTTSEMLGLNWKLTEDCHVSLCLIFCGKNFILTRKSTTEVFS